MTDRPAVAALLDRLIRTAHQAGMDLAEHVPASEHPIRDAEVHAAKRAVLAALDAGEPGPVAWVPEREGVMLFQYATRERSRVEEYVAWRQRDKMFDGDETMTVHPLYAAPPSVEPVAIEALAKDIARLAEGPDAGWGIYADLVRSHLRATPPARGADARRLTDAIAKVCEGFDKGLFVRNTNLDHEGAWAFKFLPYLSALAALNDSIDATSPTPESR